MRLIDADELKHKFFDAVYSNDNPKRLTDLFKIIDSMPTAYDVEAAKEEIDNLCDAARKRIPGAIVQHGRESAEHKILCAQMAAHAVDFEIVETQARLAELEGAE